MLVYGLVECKDSHTDRSRIGETVREWTAPAVEHEDASAGLSFEWLESSPKKPRMPTPDRPFERLTEAHTRDRTIAKDSQNPVVTRSAGRRRATAPVARVLRGTMLTASPADLD